MKTNFEKVLEFNKAFGAYCSDVVYKDIFEKEPNLLKKRLSLITEEYNGLLKAVEAEDFNSIVDACIDQLYVIYGFLQALGIDADKAFEFVHQYNMSKLCLSERR